MRRLPFPIGRVSQKNQPQGITSSRKPTMKEADLFGQYAKEAAHSSSKATSREEKDALIALACTWAQAALMSGRVLGSSFVPSPHYPSLKETHPVF
jgi:hypothetical protein